MKKIVNILVASILMMTIGSTILSCEDENIGLGSGIVGGDVEGNSASYDVIAYNSYVDSIRSDQNVLQNALLGTYEDNIFGKTDASLVSQLRLTALSPNFGANAQVDSVNLIIPVYTVNTLDSINTDTINLSNPGVKPIDSDTILIKRVYKVDSIYGNRNIPMKINVREINTALFTNKTYFSNSNPNSDSYIDIAPTILGSETVTDRIENITIKQKSESVNIYSEAIGFKIKLSKEYFQDKIINNQNTGGLADQATFLRTVIKGLHLSTEGPGFLLAFNPSNIQLNMYYTSDNAVDATLDRVKSSYGFNFSGFWGATPGPNVQVSLLNQSNKSDSFLNNLNPVFKESGSPPLFLNGADGTRVHVKLPEAQVEQLRNDFRTNNWTIVGAKLRFYVDQSYNYPEANFISAWNEYTDQGERVNVLYSDVIDYFNGYPYTVHFNPMIGDKDYYTIDISLHIKDIIEKGAVYLDQEMIVTMGNFLINSNSTSIYSTNPFYRNTVANPGRVVLHGNATEQLDKKLKLLVYYANK